jgi:beta-glucuronidase
VRLTLVVYNNRSWETLPPGRFVEAAGARRLQLWSGQWPFTGVHGSVQLVALPARGRIADLATATTLGPEDAAALAVRVELLGGAGSPARTINATLRDAGGVTAAVASGPAIHGTAHLSLAVAAPMLWWPAGTKTGAYLYTLEVCVLDIEARARGLVNGRGEVGCVDVYRLSVGLRTVRVSLGRMVALSPHGRSFPTAHPLYTRSAA